TAEALEDIAHDGGRIALQQFLDCRQIRRLASEKMLGAERGQIIGRVAELHGMRFLGGEIDQDLVEKKIPLGHAAEPPAFVEAKRARPQQFELVGLARGQLSSFDEFLQFGIHDGVEQATKKASIREWKLKFCHGLTQMKHGLE